MHISLQIIIAALTVLGLYFCLKTLASLIFTSSLICATVIVESKDQLSELDILIPEAASTLFAVRGRRTAVLIPQNIWNACTPNEQEHACEIARTLGASLYFTITLDF